MRRILAKVAAGATIVVAATLGVLPAVTGLGIEVAAAAPRLPATIPALTGWQASSGEWTATAQTVVVRPAAMQTGAQLLVDELGVYTGGQIAVAESSTAPNTIKLVVDPSRRDQLKEEGYELKIEASGVTITGATTSGAFWGTRTLSQMLRQQLGLPAGMVVDVPKYAERAVTLCACQINIAPEWIDRFLNEMADLKLNQILLEMKLKSEKYPEANTWSYYTREDVASLVAKADAYGIDVIPEINSPGHMNVWLENKPELQLVNNAGRRSADQLDISNPAAVKFYTDLIDEYDGVFTTDFWHMGADEYMMGTNFGNFNALTAWAKQTYGSAATIGDAFIGFINHVNAHVKAKGKKLRMWNDGYIDTSVVKLDKDVVIEFWLGTGRNVRAVAAEGYKLQNAHLDLYYSRGAPTAYKIQRLGPGALYNRWNVGIFPGGSLPEDHEAILGAKLSIWPDSGTRQTENEVEAEVHDGMRYAAQMFWAGRTPASDPTWDDFKTNRVAKIERSPLWENRDTAPVAPGSYTITAPSGAGLRVGDALTTGNSDSWTLTATPDGYFQVKSSDADRCIGVWSGDKHLATVTQVGAAVEARACADVSYEWNPGDGQGNYELRNPQKWEFIPVDKAAGKYQLRNAVTLQYLTEATGSEPNHVDFKADGSRRPAAGALVQLPRDVNVEQSDVFTLVRDARSFSGVAAASQDTVFPAAAVQDGIDDKGEATVTVTVTNTGLEPLNDVKVLAPVVPGFAFDTAEQTIASIAANGTGAATFKVRSTWRLGQKNLSFTIKSGEQERTASVALLGTCGPSFRPVASAADSEELNGEGSVNGRKGAATDGRLDTFWHTRWLGAKPNFPHWIEVDLGQVRQVCGYVYVPRSGSTPNGRVKDFELWAYDVQNSGAADMVKDGSLPNSTDPFIIPLDGISTRYLQFVGRNAQPTVTDPHVMSAAEIWVTLGTLPAQPTLVTPPVVTFDDASLKYTIPALEGVEYVVDGAVVAAGEVAATPGQEVTVTARPKASHDFNDDVTRSWSHKFVATITPQAVSFDDAAMTYTVPNQAGVQYKYGASVVAPGTYTAKAGETVVVEALVVDSNAYRFAEGAVTNWTHTFPASPGTPTPPPVASTVVRIGGISRVDTAIKVAQSMGPRTKAVLASGTVFADALAAGPLANVLDAPVYLTGGKSLEPTVLAALQAQGVREVTIAGGPSAVSPAAETALTKAGLTVTRVAGVDRYDTSVRLAQQAIAKNGKPIERVFVTDGNNFPDALATGAVSTQAASVTVLTRGGAMPGKVKDFLASFPGKVVVAGGAADKAAKASGVKVDQRLVGADRFATSLQIARAFPGQGTIVLATGSSFADSLPGGVLSAERGGVLLLTTPTRLPVDVVDYVRTAKRPVSAVILGGPKSVSVGVENALQALLK
ncbi:MAG: cell wall-binding repeat-containing protein [Buchananella hordeovulneris]|nr:cell wall-binding repeat-containing protein [Buchananella hordeovulneris]